TMDSIMTAVKQAGEKLSSNSELEICYEPVKASDRCDDEPYRVDGVICEQPLQMHYWASDDVPDDAQSRIQLALDACANHVVALLSGGHTIGDKPVRPGDIAVLLPSNAQITTLRDLLSARAVPCVASAKSSVFGSDWARELQIILYAALHPRDEAAVRAALATRLGGKTYNQLRALRDQPEDWQRAAGVYVELDHLWQARGVLALVQQITSDARSRLFARDDSERTLTDLRHLGELLQARSEDLTGREQLLTWLADQRDDDGDEAGDAVDEMQLRIESDAARVRLMTLHSSKGLEFPIVLLPLMWANKHNSRDTITVLHDAASGQRVVGFGAEAKQRYQQEGQDERFRLLYVALTRARYACHVYALSPLRLSKKGAGGSDTDPNRAPLDTVIERLLEFADPPHTMHHVLWCNGAWPWRRAQYQPGNSDESPERHVLSEPETTRFEYKYSFSALAKGGKITSLEERAASDEAQLHETALELPDAEFEVESSATCFLADEEATEAEQPQLQWLAQIAGADFGNALHAIFEHRVIGRPMADQHALIRRCLLDEVVNLGDIAIDELVAHLAARVQATLDTPLLPGSDPTLTLAVLPMHALRAEMEFNFVLDEVSLRRLREVCDFVPGTSMQPLRGLMNGKIDLVFEHGGRFHVLDYKGNRLDDGGDPRSHAYLSNYAPARLQLAMDHAHYRFQALLYTVAIDRYLRQRMPNYQRDKHLGETIYLFVRATGIALDTVPNAGIWAHRFEDAVIDAVDAVFASEARNAA
ncbi:MAG: 3'-5' exonuclease, partial [Dokdonella sp.]